MSDFVIREAPSSPSILLTSEGTIQFVVEGEPMLEMRQSGVILVRGEQVDDNHAVYEAWKDITASFWVSSF